MKINKELLKKQIKLSSELYQKPAYNNEGMKKLIDNYKQILEACMENNNETYTTTTDVYKGNPTISIFSGDKRILSFGLRKAKAILGVIEEIKSFVESNENASSNSATIDLSKLTPEQQALINSFIQK